MNNDKMMMCTQNSSIVLKACDSYKIINVPVSMQSWSHKTGFEGPLFYCYCDNFNQTTKVKEVCIILYDQIERGWGVMPS